MSQISGSVKEIYEGTVQSGRSAGKPFWTITLDSDAKLSCFTGEFIKGIQEGKEYNFPITQKGEYINISAEITPIIQMDENPAEQEPPYTPNTHTTEPASKVRQDSAVKPTTTQATERDYKNRISAVSAAVTYVVGTMGGTSTGGDVILTAILFEAYIKEGVYVKELDK